MLFTIRDHVIYNETDKQLFLNRHPLPKNFMVAKTRLLLRI